MTESQSKPKSFEVTLYRSGFDDIEIVLAAKDSAQACQKAIKAYGSWNVVRAQEVQPKPAFCSRCDIKVDAQQPETLIMLQAQAEKYMQPQVRGGLDADWRDVLFEQMTRAYNAGYQAHSEDLAARAEEAADYERDQEVRREEYARGIEPVCGMVEQSAEDRRRQLERRQDQADLVDLILHYKNPADDETRMRQIRVVMD